MPQSGKLPVLNLLKGKKIRFFAHQWRLVAPIQVKLVRADGHIGPLGCAKLYLNRRREWECGPQNIKEFHFLVNIGLAHANPFIEFENFKGLYTLNYLASGFQI